MTAIIQMHSFDYSEEGKTICYKNIPHIEAATFIFIQENFNWISVLKYKTFFHSDTLFPVQVL